MIFINWIVTQGIYSRTNMFDQNFFQVVTVEDVARQLKRPGLWLSIQVTIILHATSILILTLGSY